MQTGVEPLFPVRDQIHIASYGADDAWKTAGHSLHQGKAQALSEGDEEKRICCGIQQGNIRPVAQKMHPIRQVKLAAQGNVVFQLLPTPGAQQVDALVPLANMFGYATDLRSSTQGRGQYTMEPHSYCELPKNLRDKIVETRTKTQG